jgi:hypothetical protein
MVVRPEQDDRAERNNFDVVHENRAALAQILDYPAVVDDLVLDLHGCAVDLPRTLDDVDRPDDAGAEAERLGQQDLHQSLRGPCSSG